MKNVLNQKMTILQQEMTILQKETTSVQKEMQDNYNQLLQENTKLRHQAENHNQRNTNLEHELDKLKDNYHNILQVGTKQYDINYVILLRPIHAIWAYCQSPL